MMELVKAPDPAGAPCAVLVANAMVGLIAVSQTTPCSVELGTPRLVILPFPVAVVCVMLVTACVVTIGAVGVKEVVKVTSSLYEVPAVLVA